MNRKALFLLIGAVAAWYVLTQTAPGESAVETVTAAIAGWQSVNQGPVWVPVINQSELASGIPTNLLARQAYQESRFRQDVISGATSSSAGALGILQLEPQFFSTVQVPTPFAASDTTAQISQAAQQMAALYTEFGDWGVALAAYDWGAGNVSAYLKNPYNATSNPGGIQLPAETQAYVSEILTDVPVPSSLMA